MSATSDDYSAALQLHLAGRDGEAERLCDCILAANPNFVEAWNLRGAIALNAHRYENAVRFLEHAVELRPDYADPHNNLGLALQARGDLAAAISCFRRAIELQPTFAVAFSNLGNALRSAGDTAGAIESCARAVKIHPGYADGHLNLGIALYEANNLDDAAASFLRALNFDPSFAQAHYNLGCIARARGHFKDAEAAFLRAVAISPDLAEAQKNLAQIDLLMGYFKRGWQRFEWRWKTGELPVRDFNQPRWTGEPLKGKTILVWAEQGLGDTFQFIRYAALVQRLGANIIFECPSGLENILAGCAGVDQLVSTALERPVFDYHVALLSLPGILETRLETIPAQIPYLCANAALVLEWRRRLEGVNGLRIGVNWKGRGGNGPWRQRDVPVESFVSLARMHGATLVSLQKRSENDERATQPGQGPILELGDFDTVHGAFMDTAAIMMNLDLVITSDTAIPHLAGALGVPVWLALPYVPDWRWLLDRSDSPWYPTMRLFRQKQPGDWGSVFEEIETALRTLL